MIKLEKILHQKLSEIEELYDSDFSAKDHLHRLKKQRAEIKYTREVRYQMLESYRQPDAIDIEVERLDKLINQAIDDALNDINFDENNRKVSELTLKQHQLVTEFIGLDDV
tara:strand:+ start:80 stop:412 length:333 start_codon:yes stop_codon:yes gene_type:complete